MSIFDTIKNLFNRNKVQQQGKIFLKPSEKEAGAALAERTGVEVYVPETNEVYVPERKGYVTSRYRSSTPTRTKSQEQQQFEQEVLKEVLKQPGFEMKQPTQAELMSRQLNQQNLQRKYLPQYNLTVVTSPNKYGTISDYPQMQVYPGDIRKIERPTLYQVASAPAKPVLKFLGGEYQWQKDILEGKSKPDIKLKENKYLMKAEEQINKVLNYNKDLKEGDVYYMTTTGETGKALPGGLTPYGKSATFYEYKDGLWVERPDYKTIVSETSKYFWKGSSKIPIKKGPEIQISPEISDFPGQIALWGAFSPFMTSGVAAKQKQLSKSQFKELEEFYGSLRQDLVERTAGKEQITYLEQIYTKHFKGKPNGKENFKKLLQNLYEEGTFKGIPVEIYSKPKTQLTQEQQLFSEISIEVPQMRNIPVIGSTVQVQGFFDPKKVREMNVQPQKVRQIEWLTSQNTKVSGNVFSSSKINEALAQRSKQRMKTSQILISKLNTKQIQKQIPRQESPQKVRQDTTNIIKTSQDLFLKQTPKLTPKEVPKQTYTPRQRIPKRKVPTRRVPKRIYLPSIKRPTRRKVYKRKIIPKEEYTGWVKRFGVWKPIVKGSKKKVISKTTRNVLGSLSASYFVTNPKGNPIIIPTSKQFRKSKKNPFVLVEKSKYRLNAPKEKSEIKFWKQKKSKKKGGKKKWI